MFGRELFTSAVALGFGGVSLTVEDPAGLIDLVDRVPPGTRLLHLQVNDWLFAGASVTARDQLLAFASRLRDRGVALSVTLHDLPHAAVSDALYRRRVATYAAVAAAAVGIVVSSRHEAELLARAVWAVDATARVPAVTVIPLPVSATPVANPVVVRSFGDLPAIGVFGFIYPGKGHAEVIDELVGIDTPVRMVALGRASVGHEDLPAALADRAMSGGMRFTTTGFVPADEVDTMLRSVDVPVAPAAEVSASGSINSWIAAGRRPLVLAGSYTREFADRYPGCVQLYEAGELRARVTDALAAPLSTWLAAGAVVDAGPAVAAQRYLDWLRAMVDRC